MNNEIDIGIHESICETGTQFDTLKKKDYFLNRIFANQVHFFTFATL